MKKLKKVFVGVAAEPQHQQIPYTHPSGAVIVSDRRESNNTLPSGAVIVSDRRESNNILSKRR
ncbi:MAG: hypothetical protein MJZ56_07600 [Bacteroidales bacterium]|nr:hypothetical protein [Bacteroidales bacterium]